MKLLELLKSTAFRSSSFTIIQTHRYFGQRQTIRSKKERYRLTKRNKNSYNRFKYCLFINNFSIDQQNRTANRIQNFPDCEQKNAQQNGNNKIVKIIQTMLQKYNSGLSLLEQSQLSMSESVKLDSGDPYGSLKHSAKKGRNFGVNTSRIMYNGSDSFEMIQPITHLQFSEIARKYESDGLDEETCAPVRCSDSSPIYNSQSFPAKSQHAFNSKVHKKFYPSTNTKASLNPQKSQPPARQTKKLSRMQQIVNANLKNVQAGQQLIKQSRRSNKTGEKPSIENEDRPIIRKSFKISNINSKLSESKLALKEEIMLDAKKMVEQGNGDFKEKDSVARKKNNNVDNSKSRPKYQYLKATPPPIDNENTLNITLTTKISKLKRVLIEGEQQLNLNFVLPSALLQFPNPETTTAELKQKMTSIFAEINYETQIVSIKKYQDRVELRNKSLCIIWAYNGKGYFGEWKGEQILADLNRHGIGLQWSASPQNEQTYYGEFRDNKRQGYGILKNKSREIYIGCWKDGRKCGWGKLYGSDGKLRYKGEFVSDQIININ